MSSLKVLWFSFNGFSKRVYVLNYSPRRVDNCTRWSNYPWKRAINSPKMGLNFPPKRLTYPLKRLIFLQRGSVVKAFLIRGLCKSKLWSMQSMGKRCLSRIVKSGFEICCKYRPVKAEM